MAWLQDLSLMALADEELPVEGSESKPIVLADLLHWRDEPAPAHKDRIAEG